MTRLDFCNTCSSSEMHWSRYQSIMGLSKWRRRCSTCSLPRAAVRSSLRRWHDFYDNQLRLHSGVRYITPSDKPNGLEQGIFVERDRILEEARKRRQQVRQAARAAARSAEREVA